MTFLDETWKVKTCFLPLGAILKFKVRKNTLTAMTIKLDLQCFKMVVFNIQLNISLSPGAAGKHHTLNKKSFLHFTFYFQTIYIFDKYNTFISNPKAVLKE